MSLWIDTCFVKTGLRETFTLPMSSQLCCSLNFGCTKIPLVPIFYHGINEGILMVDEVDVVNKERVGRSHFCLAQAVDLLRDEPMICIFKVWIDILRNCFVGWIPCRIHWHGLVTVGSTVSNGKGVPGQIARHPSKIKSYFRFQPSISSTCWAIIFVSNNTCQIGYPHQDWATAPPSRFTSCPYEHFIQWSQYLAKFQQILEWQAAWSISSKTPSSNHSNIIL